MPVLDALIPLAVAAAAGALIGAERQQAHGERKASEFGGVRTFPLVAILGALGALLRPTLGAWIIGAFLAAVAVTLGIAQARAKGEDVGVTSEIAALVTFALGVVSGTRDFLPDVPRFLLVAGLAATTMVLLALKGTLHRFVAKVSDDDVYATAKFVILALVVIPLLPNQTYGPLQVLNPRKIGLMITLVAGVSFAGYVVARVVGSRRGLLVTGIIGGLVSSTALTMALSPRAKEQPLLAGPCAVGIVAACSTMFARVVLLVAVIQPPLLASLSLPMGAMTVTGYVIAIRAYRKPTDQAAQETISFKNPFELSLAVKFGLLYAVIQLAARAAEIYVGAAGVYASSVLAGLTDVDAITISLAELHKSGHAASLAASGITLAAFTNTLTKAGLAAALGGRQLGRQVIRALFLILLVGLLGLGAEHWLL